MYYGGAPDYWLPNNFALFASYLISNRSKYLVVKAPSVFSKHYVISHLKNRRSQNYLRFEYIVGESFPITHNFYDAIKFKNKKIWFANKHQTAARTESTRSFSQWPAMPLPWTRKREQNRFQYRVNDLEGDEECGGCNEMLSCNALIVFLLVNSFRAVIKLRNAEVVNGVVINIK